jgi:hypothetical protein
MTGAELATELEALLASNPRLSKWRTGNYLFSSRYGIGTLRKTKLVRQATIIKVRAFIANPPAEAFKRPSTGSRGRTPCSAEANERRKASIRRSVSRKARALIAGDESILTTGGRVNQTVATAMVAIRATMEAERRATDPIEQALLKIRRSRRIVYRASVHGGPPDRFYVSGKGRETIGIPELLKMAEAA